MRAANARSQCAHLKGVVPYISSYSRMPKLHQSTGAAWPAALMTSGARYSSVPTKLFARADGSATSSSVSPLGTCPGGGALGPAS